MPYIKINCPVCGGFHTATWNDETCLYHCHHCNAKGTIETPEPESKPTSQKECEMTEPISDQNIIDWFAKRGISKQTLIDLRVTTGIDWMLPANGRRYPNGCNTPTIHFNYFLDGELQFTKLRSFDKCFRFSSSVSDTELIPYNLDSIRDTDTCYITEGEIDTLSLHEIGITNVVSAPSGPFGTRWIDNCYETHFKHKQKIIICADTDDRGLLFANQIKDHIFDKMGKDLVEICADYGTDPDTGKFVIDPNCSLVKFGKEFLRDHILNFIP